MTYRLIDTRDNSTIREWGQLPGRIHEPGKFSLSPVKVGDTQGNYMLVDVVTKSTPPTKFHQRTGIGESRSGSRVTRTAAFSAATVAQAKQRLKREIRRAANERLRETDWYAIRASEDATKEVPTAIKTYREAVRTHVTTLEAEIDNLTTLAALHEWQESNWPELT